MNKEITLNGETYTKIEAPQKETRKIVRGVDSGVFFAEITAISEDRRVVDMIRARRIWWWEGAASLSQLALEGPSKPLKCKFPCESSGYIPDCCEVLDVTDAAAAAIDAVPVWEFCDE